MENLFVCLLLLASADCCDFVVAAAALQFSWCRQNWREKLSSWRNVWKSWKWTIPIRHWAHARACRPSQLPSRLLPTGCKYRNQH